MKQNRQKTHTIRQVTYKKKRKDIQNRLWYIIYRQSKDYIRNQNLLWLKNPINNYYYYIILYYIILYNLIIFN